MQTKILRGRGFHEASGKEYSGERILRVFFLWGSSSLKMGLDPPSALNEQNCWALTFLGKLLGIKPNKVVRGSEIPGCLWGELGRGGLGFQSLDMVYDYKGKLTTLEGLEHSTPCT